MVKTNRLLKQPSTGGLVVEFSPATLEARVQFPTSADLFFFFAFEFALSSWGDTLGSFLYIYFKRIHEVQRLIATGLRDIHNWLRDERIIYYNYLLKMKRSSARVVSTHIVYSKIINRL